MNKISPPQHSRLPWKLVEKRHRQRVVDDDGRTVLHCPKFLTDQDKANLELIVAAANAPYIASMRPGASEDRRSQMGDREAAVPAFTIHEREGDIAVDPQQMGAA